MASSELKKEFIELRNGKMTRPPTSNKRQYQLYLDHQIDSDKLADLKTDEELEAAIKKMKAQ